MININVYSECTSIDELGHERLADLKEDFDERADRLTFVRFYREFY